MTRYTSIAALLVGLAGCQHDVQDAGDIPAGASTGSLAVRIAGDADGQGDVNSSVDEVWIRLSDVQVRHEDRGWISVLTDREDIDLMHLRGGEPGREIGSAEVYEGSYDTLKLILADSWIVVDGEEQDLRIAGPVLPTEEGIDFDQDFFVDQGDTTLLAVGWDLDTQLSQDGEGWVLGTDASIDVNLHDQQ